MKKAHRKTRVLLLGALVTALIAAGVFIASCGSEYEKPSTTQTSALITPETLNAWINEGIVNGSGYDKVVILDITDATTYASGHIPGAFFVDSNDIAQTRNEGVAASATEVPEGLKMDALIQKYGIDGTTTVVFTGKGVSSGIPSGLLNATRAYYTFRYWGFPKNRLKVLDGVNGLTTSTGTWANLYGLTTAASPPAAMSSYSVRENGVLRGDLRLSLSEMIEYAQGNVSNALAIDTRGPTGSYIGTAGSTSGAFGASGDYPAFEGRIHGAQAVAYTDMYDAANFYRFKSASTLTQVFANVGLNSTQTAYLYCRVGQLSNFVFFVLDGMLGWPVALYDGSWLQWGALGPLVPSTPSFPLATADYVTSGLLGTKPASGLAMTSPTGEYVINGSIYTRGTDAYTYPVSSDIYDDLDAAGTTTHTAVAVGDPAPAQTADTVRIQKVTTDSTDITAVQDLRVVQPNDYVATGLLGTRPSSGLSMTSPVGHYVINLTAYARGVETYAYPANSDIYDDVGAGGTTHTAVALGATAPAVAANTLRVQKVSTNNSAITAVTDMRTARPDWVVSGLLGTVPSTKSLTMTSPVGTYVIRGTTYSRAAGDAYTYPATMDIYDDIDTAGVTTHSAVALGTTNPPAPPAGSIRIQKVSTDSVGITSVTDLRIYPSPNIQLNSRWRTDTLTDYVTYDFERGKAVELLGLDGSTCSGTYSVDGAKSYSPSGCTFSSPKSDDVSANQIEEADEAYMNAGSGSGSSSGGGGSIPTGC